MFIVVIISLLMLLSTTVRSQDDPDVPRNILVKACREREVLLAANKTEFVKLVEIPIGFKLQLQCRYCKEPDDEKPKIWYRIYNFNKTNVKEVELDMNNDITLNRVMVNPRHSLIVINVTQNDSGQYLCRSSSGNEDDYTFSYLVHNVFEEEVKPETGSLNIWETYSKETMYPLNDLLLTSAGSEYTYLRANLKMHTELITEWDDFGSCEVCGRPRNDGVRRRVGRCRLKIKSKLNATASLNLTNLEMILIKSDQIPCRSVVFSQLVPGISNITRLIPDFVQSEHCEGICNPDAEGIYRGWQSTKKTGFKFRKTLVLAENSHITIICPESTLENTVVWKHKSKTINPGSAQVSIEPRVSVDTFNTLYLYDVTQNQEGNYTCYVDNVRMQQVIVFVVSKSKLLTQAFVRHMMYLAFVLSLTLTCYCAGLVVTWTRRKKFKSFEELYAQEKLLNDLDDFV